MVVTNSFKERFRHCKLAVASIVFFTFLLPTIGCSSQSHRKTKYSGVYTLTKRVPKNSFEKGLLKKLQEAPAALQLEVRGFIVKFEKGYTAASGLYCRQGLIFPTGVENKSKGHRLLCTKNRKSWFLVPLVVKLPTTRDRVIQNHRRTDAIGTKKKNLQDLSVSSKKAAK